MDCPSRSSCPPSRTTTPLMILLSVLLPLPLAPISATTSPAFTSRFASERATTPPYRFTTLRAESDRAMLRLLDEELLYFVVGHDAIQQECGGLVLALSVEDLLEVVLGHNDRDRDHELHIAGAAELGRVDLLAHQHVHRNAQAGG